MITNTTTALKLPLNIDAWKLFSEGNIEIIQLELKADEEIEPHINPVDVVFYVVSGLGIASIEGDNSELSAGDCLSVKAGISRGWKNSSGKPLKLLLVKYEV